MQEESQRATAVITALLAQDNKLARHLIVSDPDPEGLAFGAATLAAGMWDHYASLSGTDPAEQWARSLIASKRRK